MSMSIFTSSFQYRPRKREFWMRFRSYSTSVIHHVNKQYLCMGLLQRRMGLRGKEFIVASGAFFSKVPKTGLHSKTVC